MADKPNARRRMQVFYAKDAPDVPPEMMPREGVTDSIMSGLVKLQEAGVTEGVGAVNRVLFQEPGEDGMSLLYIWFKSGYVLPFHSHSSDCLYYVIGGELRMGSRVLRKGDGVFIPKDHGYGYEAGPEGVEVLEFRNTKHFNLFFQNNPESRWDKIADTVRERAAIWEEEAPPSGR